MVSVRKFQDTQVRSHMKNLYIIWWGCQREEARRPPPLPQILYSLWFSYPLDFLYKCSLFGLLEHKETLTGICIQNLKKKLMKTIHLPTIKFHRWICLCQNTIVISYLSRVLIWHLFIVDKWGAELLFNRFTLFSKKKVLSKYERPEGKT